MSAYGGPNSSFEKAFKKSITSLDKSIQLHSDNISKILITAYDRPQAKAAYWNEVRRKLDKEYKALNSIYISWSRKAIPSAYKLSVKEIMGRLNQSKAIAKKAKRSYSELVSSNKSFTLTSALFRDANLDWTNALTMGQSNINRLTRRTQQALIQERAVDISVARAIESGNLMNNTFISTLNMSSSLASQLDAIATIIDGEKYVIAGSRKYKPKYYAEMVSRVKFHEAQAYGAIQTAGNYGTSLVRVSSHNTTTALCLPFEGMVFSIGGKDKRFPPLTDTPPYHVNCLHNLFPTFIEGMEAQGSLHGWIDFSNGKIDRPPAPKSFIPVKEREAV